MAARAVAVASLPSEPAANPQSANPFFEIVDLPGSIERSLIFRYSFVGQGDDKLAAIQDV
jgi:hypothetical protein